MSNSTVLSQDTQSILVIVTLALVIWSLVILCTLSCGIINIHFTTEDTNKKVRKIKNARDPRNNS